MIPTSFVSIFCHRKVAQALELTLESSPICLVRTILLFVHSPFYARVCSLAPPFSNWPASSLQACRHPLNANPKLFLEAHPHQQHAAGSALSHIGHAIDAQIHILASVTLFFDPIFKPLHTPGTLSDKWNFFLPYHSVLGAFSVVEVKQPLRFVFVSSL